MGPSQQIAVSKYVQAKTGLAEPGFSFCRSFLFPVRSRSGPDLAPVKRTFHFTTYQMRQQNRFSMPNGWGHRFPSCWLIACSGSGTADPNFVAFSAASHCSGKREEPWSLSSDPIMSTVCRYGRRLSWCRNTGRPSRATIAATTSQSWLWPTPQFFHIAN